MKIRIMVIVFCLCISSVYAHELSEQKTPAAWYALGCQAYHKGEYARACCLWHRACAVGGDATVRDRCVHNCRYACQKLTVEEPSVPWWYCFCESCTRIPRIFVQLLFLVILYSALFFACRARWQRKFRVAPTIFFVGAVLFSGLLAINYYCCDVRKLYLVVHDQQVLYAGPGSDYPERGHIPCGQTVDLCNCRGEWYKVRSLAGETGWLPRATCMSVKP